MDVGDFDEAEGDRQLEAAGTAGAGVEVEDSFFVDVVGDVGVAEEKMCGPESREVRAGGRIPLIIGRGLTARARKASSASMNFYACAPCQTTYRAHIQTVIKRVNTVNGRTYRDDGNGLIEA